MSLVWKLRSTVVAVTGAGAGFRVKRFLPLPLFAVGFAFTLVWQPVSADSDSVLQEVTTPDGHKFWYYAMPKAARTAIAVNWAQQVPLDEGIHPSTARVGIDVMLNGGAGGRDAAQIVADYQDLDAGSGLWVQPNDVSGFIVAPDQHLATAREIAHDVITKPALEQRWFDREHQNLVDRALEDHASSWGIAWNLARDVALGDHAFNKFWSDLPHDGIKSISLADVKDWYKSSFSSATATVAVAGSASIDVAAKELDLLLGGLPKHEPSAPVDFPKPSIEGKTILLHNPDAPKSVVILLGNFAPNDEETVVPLNLGVGVLGQSKQSRLFKTVRSGLGASYGFGAGLFEFTREHRMLEMSGEVETAKLSEALSEIEHTYKKFRAKGIGRVEFPLAKRFYKREFEKQLRNPTSMAFTVIEVVRKGYSDDYVHTLPDRLDSLERSSTNRLISELFPAYDQLLTVIVSPDDKAVEGACVVSKIEEAANC